MNGCWRWAFSLLCRAQNEPRLSAVKEPRKSVHAPDCESRSEEAKERTADDTRGRDEGVREIKGRGSRDWQGGKEQIILKPVERIGLQLSTGRKIQPVNARVCQLIIFIEGLRRVFLFQDAGDRPEGVTAREFLLMFRYIERFSRQAISTRLRWKKTFGVHYALPKTDDETNYVEC